MKTLLAISLISILAISTSVQSQPTNVTVLPPPDLSGSSSVFFVSDQASLSNAILAAGTKNAALSVTKIVNIDKALGYPIPQNITLSIQSGSGFKIAKGVKLTHFGGLVAGKYQIFYGDGTVEFYDQKGSKRGGSREVWVDWFGARRDDNREAAKTTLDAINKAVKSIEVGDIVFSAGQYQVNGPVTPITTGHPIHIHGQGREATTIVFFPEDPDRTKCLVSLFTIADPSRRLVWGASITDLAITGGSSDPDLAANGITVKQGRGILIRDVKINFPHKIGNGFNMNSIGLHIFGRDESNVEHVDIHAPRPIVFGYETPIDPKKESPGLDHWNFRDLVLYNLGANINDHPLIEVGPHKNMVLSNVAFEGKQVWVGGNGGFIFIEGNSNYLSFENIRWETGALNRQGPTKPIFDIRPTRVVNNLTFENLRGGGSTSGSTLFRLKKCQTVNFNNVYVKGRECGSSLITVDNISDWGVLLFEIKEDTKSLTTKLLTPKLNAKQLEDIKKIKDVKQLTDKMKGAIVAAFNAIIKDNLSFYKDEVASNAIESDREVLQKEFNNLKEILEKEEKVLSASQKEDIKWFNIAILKNLFPKILSKSQNCQALIAYNISDCDRVMFSNFVTGKGYFTKNIIDKMTKLYGSGHQGYGVEHEAVQYYVRKIKENYTYNVEKTKHPENFREQNHQYFQIMDHRVWTKSLEIPEGHTFHIPSFYGSIAQIFVTFDEGTEGGAPGGGHFLISDKMGYGKELEAYKISGTSNIVPHYKVPKDHVGVARWPGRVSAIVKNNLCSTRRFSIIVYWVPKKIHLEAEQYSKGSAGLKKEECSEGGLLLGNIEDGFWVLFESVDIASDGIYTFKARVASATEGGKIEIRLDNKNEEPVGVCQVYGTGGSQNWETVTCKLKIKQEITGKRDVYLIFKNGEHKDLFNINWIEFGP